MGTTFAQRFWKGLASSALAQIIGALNAVVLVPLFLRTWGADGYGRWLALTALVSYLSLLDLGGQSYVGNLLAIEYTKQDQAAFRRVLSAGVSLFVLIALGVFLGVMFLTSLPDASFPGLARSLNLDERSVIVFTSASLLLSIPGGVYVMVYRSTGLFARGTMIGNVIRLMVLGVSIVLLYVGAGPGTYAAGLFALNVLSTLTVIWDTQRHIPQCKNPKLSLAVAKEGFVYLKGSLYFWLIALAGAINQQGVLIVLTAFGSPVAVAVFATHRTVAGLLRYISTWLQGPLWPEFSFLWAANQRASIERLVVITTGATMLCTGVIAVALYMFFPYIYPIWTGKTLNIQMPLLGILLLQGVLGAGWLTASWGLLASNQHRQLAWWTMANALVTIIGAAILAGPWGGYGVAVASLVGDITCGLIIMPILVSRAFRISARRIFVTVMLSMLVLVPLVVAAALLSSLPPLWAISLWGLIALALSYPATVLVLGYAETKRLVGQVRQSVSLTIK